MSKDYSKMTAVAKDVSAIRYTHYKATSIANYLRSPVFGKHPKLVRKNTKAAAAEAAEIAAKAEAAACMEETKRLAAECEAMGGRTRRPAARAMVRAHPAPRVRSPCGALRGVDVGSRGDRH